MQKIKGLSDIVGKWMVDNFRDGLGVGFVADKVAASFKPDPTANPDSDFKPKSLFWKIAGLRRRDAPENLTLIHDSVTERFQKVAQYAKYVPDNIKNALETAIASQGVVDKPSTSPSQGMG